MKPRWSTVVSKYVATAVMCAIAAFPFLWMFLTSVKPAYELNKPNFWPQHWTFQAYADVWTTGRFFQYFLNSVIVAVLTTAIALALAVLAGYGFSRYRLPGGKAMLILILFSQMFPAILLAIPYFVLMKKFMLLDKLAGLVLVNTTFALPLSTWTMRNYFLTVPLDLDEAAMVDGCTRLGALWRVILPVAKPGVMAAAIFCFIQAWNEFMFANTFISQEKLRTLPLGLQSLIGQYSTDWGMLMAGSVITTLPIVLFFLIVQKNLVSGLAAGSVKE
ncbi:MAG TPA: carbohydrate ABC transporter permease [Symbiobacteriaceae bacterium]